MERAPLLHWGSWQVGVDVDAGQEKLFGLRNPGGTLLDAIWGDAAVTEDVVRMSIGELRAVFGDARSAPRFIETVPRRGYSFRNGGGLVDAPGRRGEGEVQKTLIVPFIFAP